MKKLFLFAKENIIYKSLFKLCSLAFVLIAVLFAYLGSSLGWFSRNIQVGVTGLGVSSDAFEISVKYYLYTSSDGTPPDYADKDNWNWQEVSKNTGWDQLPQFYPDREIFIKAEYTSREPDPHKGTTYFVPIAEEPLIKVVGSETHHYYFGSQLYISSLQVNDGEPTRYDADKDATVPADKFLVPYTLDGKDKPVLHFSKKVEAGNTLICENFDIPANGTATVIFSLKFINFYDINQNNYKANNFKKQSATDPDPACSRYIYTEFDKGFNAAGS